MAAMFEKLDVPVVAVRRWLVGGALIRHGDGLVLVGNRRRDKSLEWTPPGGVIDQGETLLAGLTREVFEETGLIVNAWSSRCYTVTVEAPEMGWRLTVEAWEADDVSGEICIADPDGIVEEEIRCLQAVQQIRVDGVFGSFFHVQPDDLRPLIEKNIAVVSLVAAREPVPDFPLDVLYVDNVAGACTAVTYLVEHGHTRIAMIGGLEVAVGQKRTEGYRQALAQCGIPIAHELVRHGDFTEAGGYREMQALLQITPRPTAVFTANDLMALGALFAIKENGLSVPGDVAIVGFDDIPTSRLVSPPLTTIRKSQDLIGQRAVEMILERINKTVAPLGRCEEIPFELIVRQSA